MLDRVITWSLSHRLAVVVLTLAMVGVGLIALRRLPLDAFPDTTPVQVQINAVAPALAPLEIEQQLAVPIEQAISGLPGLHEVRAVSKFGLAQVTAVFDDATSVYFARQLVSERLLAVELPAGLPRPELGPVATGLGEVFHYLVTSKAHSLEELTTLHDWVIKPRLAAVPGVAEVNTWGGEVRQFHVLVDPVRLQAYALTVPDVLAALQANNLSVGGGVLTQGGEAHLVRGVALTTMLDEIAGVAIATRDGVPIHVHDVATVSIGHETRRGAATANGEGEAVLGLGFMLAGANSQDVTRRLEAKLGEVRAALPAGVVVRPVYERTELVAQVLATVRRNLYEGAILVVAVLFALLGNLRAGLIVALAIPLSMLFAFSGMVRWGIAGSLMSLGAIDFGLVVDSSVIMVENSLRRLAADQGRRPVLDVVRDAALEVRRPTLFGELIIMIVYLPVLTLEGIEGKLFRPMALTVILALLGSMVLSLTLMPVLTSLLLRGRVRERENLLVRGAKALYAPLLRLAVQARTAVIVATLLLLGGGAWVATRLGAEFIPRLSEMAIVINTVRLAGVSLDESVRYGTRIEQLLRREFPAEIRDVWTRTGTAAVATDPMGIELSDVYLTLTPRAQWQRARTQEELTAQMRVALASLPGMRLVFSQPIELRVNEMIAGIRTDLGIKVFGDDLEVLKAKAAEVAAVLKTIPGTADLYTEQITGQPMLEVVVDQAACARHGVAASTVLQLVEAIGGVPAGEVREGQRRFALVVRLAEASRADPDAVRRLQVPTPDGGRLPLARLAAIRQVEGPSTITREWQQRRIVVQCNVSGRDVAGYVADARRQLATAVSLPPGYHLEFGGQFEHLERGRTRLMLVVPLALALILFLLYASTDSARDTLLIFSGAPFAALGGVLAIWARDLPFTISAGVGFVAVSGVSVLNGLVLVSTIRQLRDQGLALPEAVEQSALLRLRPVLMTALVAALGFVPMALNTGVGAEVQRPLATVVIGGIIANTLLTLLVLPALYVTFGRGPRADGKNGATVPAT